jgi:hypothetical protein
MENSRRLRGNAFDPERTDPLAGQKVTWWDSANSSTLSSASPLDPFNYATALLTI